MAIFPRSTECARPPFVPCSFGATLFFFISGFLITRLLIAEFNINGRIAIAKFYIRWFLRLGPALAFDIGLVTVLFLALGEPTNKWEVLAGVFYVMNYYYVLGGALPMPLGTLWSLAGTASSRKSKRDHRK